MTRRKRKSAVWRRLQPALASEWIVHFALLPNVTAVVLYLRVSSHKQQHRKNLDDQEAFLRSYLEGRGIKVIAVFRVVASGWNDGRFELEKACCTAKQHGAVVLAESTDRYVRPTDYHSQDNPDARPTVRDMEELTRCTMGVTLATFLHPDATPSEVRAHQTKRGQKFKNRKGGRPRYWPGYKKEERILNLIKVSWMTAAGMSVRLIAKCLGKHPNQIQRWRDRLRG